MSVGPLRPRFFPGGKGVFPALAASRPAAGGIEMLWRDRASGLQLRQLIARDGPRRLRVSSWLSNEGPRPLAFPRAELLTLTGVPGARFNLGRHLARVRVLEQSAYHGQVRSVGQILTGADQRLSLERTPGSFVSRLVTLFHSPDDGATLLIGFETFDRWHGIIRGGSSAARKALPKTYADINPITGAPAGMNLVNAVIKPSQRLDELAVETGGLEAPLEPGENVRLERFVIEAGGDAFDMLDDYADRVGAIYRVHEQRGPVRGPLVNWCSWYPYRLGVTQERMLDTARAAKARSLDKLGLRFIQADLGWEKHNIPTYFEENERFGRGLAWLSRRLGELGFELGVWKGFTCVAANHPIVKEHPDWLVHDEAGQFTGSGKWYWEPHVPIYNLDPSHPGAVDWVRRGVAGLAKKGVRYLKWDFGSNVTGGGIHHDPRVACNNAAEGIRRLARAVREGMGPDGVVLDCSGTEVAGVGNFQLLYTNYDTGNTGIGYPHLRGTTETLATHLFKNHRWGLLQPSCMVVGLPGTIEEARLRATTTFLSAGHVDLGDNLTNLPEDRWKILLCVLPPNPTPARAADLYRPVRISSGDAWTDDPQGANVWHCRVETDWDQWDLVALLNIAQAPIPPAAADPGAAVAPSATRRFEVPFAAVGLDPEATYWAHEFWSCQFLGAIPVPLRPRRTYRHLGDSQSLINDSRSGLLDATFTAPAVKLLVIRKPRRHPWPAATTFHQSGGRELSGVRWDARRRTLTGVLHRPPGQDGAIVIAGIPAGATPRATAADRAVPVTFAANGSVCIPITTHSEKTAWSLRLR